MTCIRIPNGFVCVNFLQVIIHKGRRWHFQIVPYCGLMFCRADGEGIDQRRVPKDVIKKVSDILKKGKKK